MLARTLGARLAPRLGASRNLSTASLQHVKLDVTESGVAMLRLDCQGEKQNTLSRELMDEMEVVVKQVETDPKVKAVVLISDKQGSFIAGANIKMVEDLGKKSASDAGDASAEGQVAMDKIASMQKTKPWVAAIDGPCLGGGLEVALACSQRVATASSKTTLGLPEVMLGLLPGAGGTQRLPKLVGAAPALDMMLTGKMIKAARAKKMGLVDLVVDANALERSAVATALDLAAGKAKAKQRKKGWMDTLLEGNPLGRKVMFDKAKEQVMKATKGKASRDPTSHAPHSPSSGVRGLEAAPLPAHGQFYDGGWYASGRASNELSGQPAHGPRLLLLTPLLPPSAAVVSMAESSLQSHAAFIVERAAYDVTVRATDDVEVVPKGAPSLYPPLFTLELTVNVGVEGVDDGIAYKVWRL